MAKILSAALVAALAVLLLTIAALSARPPQRSFDDLPGASHHATEKPLS